MIEEEDIRKLHSSKVFAFLGIAIYCWHLRVDQIEVNLEETEGLEEQILGFDDITIVLELASERDPVVTVQALVRGLVEVYNHIAEVLLKLLTKVIDEILKRVIPDV